MASCGEVTRNRILVKLSLRGWRLVMGDPPAHDRSPPVDVRFSDHYILPPIHECQKSFLVGRELLHGASWTGFMPWKGRLPRDQSATLTSVN
nr:hypothetical protein CFP56_07660 [Quercus suber]